MARPLHGRFLNTVDEVVKASEPAGTAIHIVLDNYATHKTPAVQRWLARRPEYNLHFTPTSASWLNQVERVFADLTQKQLRRGVFTSVAALEKAAIAYIDARNDDAKPFVWTADANTILGRVAKNRAVISKSGHWLTIWSLSQTFTNHVRALVVVHKSRSKPPGPRPPDYRTLELGPTLTPKAERLPAPGLALSLLTPRWRACLLSVYTVLGARPRAAAMATADSRPSASAQPQSTGPHAAWHSFHVLRYSLHEYAPHSAIAQVIRS
ncbi:MAG: transposase [Phycisphaerales bacterium]|nr:transposase [Phycisphaerales bacterium]